ncbi:MAG: hypothetical protein RLZZ200_2469 [Pseudomonadota bacterium]|jgi:hypothetical protein
MIRSLNKTLALVLLLAVTACTAPQPRTDVAAGASFGTYHRFAWYAEDALFQPGEGDKPLSLLNRQRVVEAIEATLAAKGFSRAERRDEADFLVAYSVGTRERISGTLLNDDFYRPWHWGWPYYGPNYGHHAATFDSRTEGRLAIDVLDAKTRKPVWHGVAPDTLATADLEQSGTRVVRAAQVVLDRFPPR